MRVLLVDGNMITSSKLSSLLRSAGFEVLTAKDWEDVKKALSGGDIGVVLLNFEGSVGESVLKRIKSEFPEVKVLAYCGHKNVSLQERAKGLGADLVVPNSKVVVSAPELLSSLLE